MAGPLLSSKYRLPIQRAGAVTRGRLSDRLDGALGTPLVVLSAPAGFGKTTLISTWLARSAMSGSRVAWLSLDHRDNDPALFWTYLVTAIRSAVPDLGEAVLPLLASPAATTDAAIATLLNEIETLPSDLVLALDDYQAIESPEVHQGMTFLLEHLPPQLHLIIVSRADPPLPLAHLRARGQLIEVRSDDLRFTSDETSDYLTTSMNLRLTDEDVAALEARTEGWIAALQLAALSLQGRADASAFIAGFAGDDQYIVDYLAEEVLSRQPAGVRDFLLKTSILERLTGPLCDAVTGRRDGKDTLVALERANLFLVPLDNRRQWYRYHHLFADVLQAYLLDEHRDQVADLHRRASRWFEADDDTLSAISHSLAGGDTGRAADLMELAMPRMRRERREADLARWMRALPDDLVRTRPVLAVAFVGALVQGARFDTVAERLDQVEALVRSPDGTWPEHPPAHVVVADLDHYHSLPAHVAMYRAALALAGGDVDGTIAHARHALSVAPPEDPLARAAAGALAGLAAWSTGDLAGAFNAYTESVVGLTSAGFRSDVLGCTITLGDIQRAQGRLAAALRTYRQALQPASAAPDTGPLRGTADMQVGIAGVLLERDDLAGAQECLAISHQLGEPNGLPQNAYRWRVVSARLRAAEGDLDGALTLLDEAERVYDGDFSPDVAPVAATRARLWIRRGELDLARHWAEGRRLSRDDTPSYLREYEHLTLARLLIAEHRRGGGDIDGAVGLLDRLLRAAEDGGRLAGVIEALMLRAIAQNAAGAAPAALASLRRAVSLAEPEGYVRLFIDEGLHLAALLKTLRRQPSAPAYVNRLIAVTSTIAASTRPAQPLVAPLSERELEVLRLLGGDLAGPEIARHLSVSLNTVRTHTKSIYSKLGTSSRRAAVNRARELHLIPGGERLT